MSISVDPPIDLNHLHQQQISEPIESDIITSSESITTTSLNDTMEQSEAALIDSNLKEHDTTQLSNNNHHPSSIAQSEQSTTEQETIEASKHELEDIPLSQSSEVPQPDTSNNYSSVAATSSSSSSSPSSSPSSSSSSSSSFKKPKVEWAPLAVPLTRRRQTFAVLLFFALQPLCILFTLFLLRYSHITAILTLNYIGWMIFFQKYHYTGGLRQDWFRRLTIWKWFRDYFPITLYKTCEIDPTKHYILGYHPHGIISMGCICNFATEANEITSLLKLDLRVVTLSLNFRIPFYGLILSFLGICDASRASIVNNLNNKRSVMIVVGGAKESLDAFPSDEYRLTLKNRKGFVKLALETGAGLIPVFSFGENDIYDQIPNPEGSKIRKFQTLSQKILGFGIPLILGRGIFQYTFGLLPQRKPINTYIGTPIHIPKLLKHEIDDIIIDKYHHIYLDTLMDMFNKYKHNHQPNAKLIFV